MWNHVVKYPAPFGESSSEIYAGIFSMEAKGKSTGRRNDVSRIRISDSPLKDQATLYEEFNKYIGKKPILEDIADYLIKHPTWEAQASQQIGEKYHIDTISVLREYNRELVARGLALKRSELKKMDTIDLSDTLGPAPANYPIKLNIDQIYDELNEAVNNAEEWAKIQELGWCIWIPCFTKGVVRYTPTRYVYWEIKEVNCTEKSVTVYIRDYAAYDNASLWQPGLEGTYTQYLDTGYAALKKVQGDITQGTPVTLEDAIPYYMATSDCRTYQDIFTEIDLNTMGWDETKQAAHNTMTVLSAIQRPLFDNNDPQYKLFYHFESLSIAFMLTMFYVNYRMHSLKPKAERRPSAPRKIKTEAAPAVVADTRIVRNIGTIHVISQKAPKVPTDESVRRYKMAVWPRRGFVRRYKSGRISYINPTVVYRQCLKGKLDPSAAVPQAYVHMNAGQQESLQNQNT